MQYPYTLRSLNADHRDTYEKILITTELVSNSSTMLRYCNSMLNSSSLFWNSTFDTYRETDNPGGVFLLSFVQNIMASVYSITNIYVSLTNNIALGDTF